MVYIGLISYSLYLWHWPLIAFSRYLLLRELTSLEVFCIILATFVISAFSLKFIEKPFRRKQPITPTRKNLFLSAATVMLIVSGIGVVISIQNGMPYLHPEANAGIKRLEETDNEWFRNYHILCDQKYPLIGKDGVVPSFILWGDSHAAALMPAIIDKAKQFGKSGFAVYGSPPVLGLDLIDTPQNEALRNEESFAFIKSHPECKTVILVARWAMHATGHESQNELPKINHRFKDTRSEVKSNLSNSGLLEIGLFKVVESLLGLGKNVVLVMDVPEIGFDVKDLLFVSRIKGKDYNKLLPNLIDYYKRNKDVEIIFSKLAIRKNVTTIYPDSMLFDKKGVAIITHSKNMLYRDDDHLSSYGARFIAPLFDGVFRDLFDK